MLPTTPWIYMFRLDPVKRTINMPDEWWTHKLKEIPKARKLKNKGPLLPDDQHFIFQGSLATAEQAWSSGSRRNMSQHFKPRRIWEDYLKSMELMLMMSTQNHLVSQLMTVQSQDTI